MLMAIDEKRVEWVADRAMILALETEMSIKQCVIQARKEYDEPLDVDASELE